MKDEFTVKDINGATTMNRAVYDQYLMALESRRAVGRYTLEEAALMLEQNAGERPKKMQDKLARAAYDGTLAIFRPGENARHEYNNSGKSGEPFIFHESSSVLPGGVSFVVSDRAQCVKTFFDEAYWDDLNNWLEANEPRINWRFPAPATEQAKPSKKSEAVERGITKGAVINAFEGMYFDRDKWNKYLGDPPDWLKECRVARGNKKISATWNPVLIAAALLDKKINIKKIDAVFVNLKDWADEWRETSASFRE